MRRRRRQRRRRRCIDGATQFGVLALQFRRLLLLQLDNLLQVSANVPRRKERVPLRVSRLESPERTPRERRTTDRI